MNKGHVTRHKRQDKRHQEKRERGTRPHKMKEVESREPEGKRGRKGGGVELMVGARQ